MKPVLHLLRPSVLSAVINPLRPTLPVLATSQIRQYASILGSLSDVPSAYNKRIRRGRGPSSGKGKTSGRGHKGQGQHGGVPHGFNGGQTKDIVVSGPRGFTNKFRAEYACLNLDRLQSWIRDGRIDTTKVITITELVKSGCVSDVKDGVKLLGDGKDEWSEKIDIVVSRVSKSAIEAIEKVGGKVTARFYNKSGLQYMANPEKHPELAHHKLADPTSRKDREYYRDPAKRGYLAGTLKEGEVPNLYFKNREIGVDSLEEKAKKVDTSANRLF